MKLSNPSSVPVYTISGTNTSRALPEWLARKRKRSLKHDPEYASRIELLQDFGFEEASCCVRVSEDGEWVMSTGTYKPQMHVHYLPHLSMSYMRHTNSLNQTFELLSSDYSKSLHLQTDRVLEFHTPGGCHHTTRIPRYGRDLKYDRRSAEALIPAVGIGESGMGEVFRLNLEAGRFMKGYDVNVGADDDKTLQGSVNVGSVNTAAIAEDSHSLLAFGTSRGTIEFWDPRSKRRAALLPPPSSPLDDPDQAAPEISCLSFHPSGLTLASGTSNGLIHLYDLRSPRPLLRKDQGYGFPIQTLTFLTSPGTASTTHLSSEPKILSSDKRIIKIWSTSDGTPWTSVEPEVDLHSVAWCRDSGMLLTANEGQQQHSFFIPQLGPAPKWCRFLDNLVEEMAEDSADAGGLSGAGAPKAGEIYDNYKFVAMAELRALNLDHLVGTTGLLRPYMHGYFVAQQLYEEARLISQPELWAERRRKTIQEKIDKERESRIRGAKRPAAVKVNKRLAERVLERDEENERRKARRAARKSLAAENGSVDAPVEPVERLDGPQRERNTLLTDPRFASLFRDADFEVDETSHEFRALNPSTKPTVPPTSDPARRRTAAEEEAEASDKNHSSSADSDSEPAPEDAGVHPSRRANLKSNPEPELDAASRHTISSASYKRSGRQRKQQKAQHRRENAPASVQQGLAMRSQSSAGGGRGGRSFGRLAADMPRYSEGDTRRKVGGQRVVGERAVTFAPREAGARRGAARGGKRGGARAGEGGKGRDWKERRSASGNTFRGL